MKIILFTLLAAAMAAAKETNVVDLLRSSNNKFTSKMFSEVTKANPGKSVVMSAFSVLTPVAQLSLAAEGASHDELLTSMSLPHDNATRDVFKFVKSDLRSVKGVDLRMASRVYIADRYELSDDFQSKSRDLFDSDVKNVDFAKSEPTAAEINHWVEEQTNNRIKDLVDSKSLDADTRAVLVNAIYFKGTWSDKFNSNLTTDRDFHVTKEKTIKVPTMTRKGDYVYGESTELDAKLLRLPYEGNQASMLIVLPNEIDGLPALEEKLKDPEALARASREMFMHEVEVFLPKFKIETTTDLKDVLQKMGVKKIFSPATAELNNLLKGEQKDNGLYVSEAKQKAFIEVNEEGAEAAAANAFVGLGMAFIPSEEFHVDRPFYFDIQLQNNNCTIFNGVIVEGSKK